MIPGNVPDLMPEMTPGYVPDLMNLPRVKFLNTICKFKDGSPLKSFINKHAGIVEDWEKTYYTVGEILTFLKQIIAGERMFDPKNPSIVLCSIPLEKALDQKALHLSEIWNVVMRQIIVVPGETIPLRSFKSDQLPRSLGQMKPWELRQLIAPLELFPYTTAAHIPNDAQFNLKPLFLLVIRSVAGTPLNQINFSYKEIAQQLSKYIIAKRYEFFDRRNIRVALVKDDVLGRAFGVSAFHRSQVQTLIWSQLIPLPANNDEPRVSRQGADAGAGEHSQDTAA